MKTVMWVWNLCKGHRIRQDALSHPQSSTSENMELKTEKQGFSSSTPPHPHPGYEICLPHPPDLGTINSGWVTRAVKSSHISLSPAQGGCRDQGSVFLFFLHSDQQETRSVGPCGHTQVVWSSGRLWQALTPPHTHTSTSTMSKAWIAPFRPVGVKPA